MARRYQAFIAATAKVSRGISMACGLWLIVGTPLVLIKSGVTLRAGDAILSIYLATFGLLMFLVEVPLGQLQKFLQAYLYFMFTRLAKVGAFTKVLLFFSAGLSTYVMFSSNRFGDTDGKASELANQIGNEVLGRAKKAWSIGEMFGISKAFSGGSPAPQSAGGFSQPEGDPTAGAWPTGGGDGA